MKTMPRRNFDRFQAKPRRNGSGKLVSYDIYMMSSKTGKLVLFLSSQVKLKRQDAYAIARLLTSEADGVMRWADKFADPYA